MGSERGVTLTSVIIYVIAMLIIVSVITVLTSYFYTNVDINSVSEDLNQQYTRFNSYFAEEVNQKGNTIIESNEQVQDDTSQKYIVFSSGNQYTYIPANQAIYMNYIKIAENITDCTFESGTENGKSTVKVIIKGENGFERTTNYTLVQ